MHEAIERVTRGSQFRVSSDMPLILSALEVKLGGSDLSRGKSIAEKYDRCHLVLRYQDEVLGLRSIAAWLRVSLQV